MRSVFTAVLCGALLMIPSYSSALTVGDRAPLFEGRSTQGKVALSDFKDRKNVVLAFYYADFTPV